MNLPRYQRQIQLPGFGPEAQQKLADAAVLVVGAGGLGVPALQYLTAMGVGRIGIVDGDVVSLSNLHRQVLYTEADVGKAKVNVAVEKLTAQNPDVRFDIYPGFLSAKNALDILASYDVIVDATDNFPARYLINDACVILNKPFVYGAAQGFEGQLSVFNYKDGPTYRCLFPAQPSPEEIPDCNTNGVLGVVPGIIGSLQAMEAIKIITGTGKPLSGVLQFWDLLDNSHYEMKLKVDPANKQITGLPESYDASFADDFSVPVETLRNWYETGKNFTLIDIREPHEFEEAHLEQARLMPVNRLVHQPENLDKNNSTLIVCQKGLRSRKAVQQIRESDPNTPIFSLEGGMESWLHKSRTAHLI